MTVVLNYMYLAVLEVDNLGPLLIGGMQRGNHEHEEVK
jgi:hypothetical protein